MTVDRALIPPPDRSSLPGFRAGWVGHGRPPEPYLRYVDDAAVNWSEELEILHEESSREHCLDVLTRRAMLRCLGPMSSTPTLADIGCSTGYLLADLRAYKPDAALIGADLVAAGLLKAYALVPQASLILADACELPLRDGSLDGVLSANLLEHVVDDAGALAEMRRVLRPGARAVIVVPAGPTLYDYYDRFLGHVRRYARGELSDRARRVGFEILQDTHLGVLLYPPFWLVKQRNRRRFEHLEGAALQERVASDIATTTHSRLGKLACRMEEGFHRTGMRAAFGIRNLVVLRRPEISS